MAMGKWRLARDHAGQPPVFEQSPSLMFMFSQPIS
ncbi:hypothetical protein ANTHELSMS3_02474 [Antarctobacter heliothermus]|uniref:Uncharacterized protein n=1 Tax=Antarctobacter heliothermus TaxID=74033 RepID=A0A222E573_9RHOB|nr:hypothetical protein ANTHELSMS3_02474 [Antarctobacter heliothermus]